MARVIQKEKHDSNYRTESLNESTPECTESWKISLTVRTAFYFKKIHFSSLRRKGQSYSPFFLLHYFSPLIANNEKGKRGEKEQGRTDGCIRVAPGLVFNFRWESPSLSVRWKKSVKSTFIWKRGKKAREWRRGEKGTSKKEINKKNSRFTQSVKMEVWERRFASWAALILSCLDILYSCPLCSYRFISALSQAICLVWSAVVRHSEIITSTLCHINHSHLVKQPPKLNLDLNNVK